MGHRNSREPVAHLAPGIVRAIELAEAEHAARNAAADARRLARMDRELAAGVESGFGALSELAQRSGFSLTPDGAPGASIRIGHKAYR